jgi:hypothetical protein
VQIIISSGGTRLMRVLDDGSRDHIRRKYRGGNLISDRRSGTELALPAKGWIQTYLPLASRCVFACGGLG